MAKSKPGSAIVGAVILLVLVGSCVVLFRPVKQTPAEVAAYKLEMAMIRCANETKGRIADSDGFEAAPYGEWRGLPDETGEGWTFSFRVKAKNAFGALVWADMMCHATYDGTYWTVVDLKQD